MRKGVPLLQDYVSASAARLPEKVALVAAQQRYTYAELDARSNALARGLFPSLFVHAEPSAGAP